ncbi:MAG TPA: hypothetical protein VM101_01725 [Flavitalea sp.]|nr:hypothetical protein [Flavitalea sp.]
MKALTQFLLLAVPLFVFGQQSAFTNQTHSTLQKVINDYPNHFKNIMGSIVVENPQTTDYTSKVQIPGSINTIITRYSSENDKEIYSWKCLMIESEEFNLASKKYKEVFNQVANSIIKLDGNKPFILNGTYADPTEDKRYTSSAFTLVPASGDLKKLKVELTLEFLITEWKISLLVYDQPDENVAMDVSTE